MNQIDLINKERLHNLTWSKEFEQEKNWIEPFIKEEPKKFIKNLETNVELLKIKNNLLPITINNFEYENSYVCSPYTAYISYATEELSKLKNPFLIFSLKSIFKILGVVLKFIQINQVVCCNNWMLSTNLYETFDFSFIPKSTKFLKIKFPKHFFIFRSLNFYNNSDLIKALKQAGYDLLPSRQVYIFDRSKKDYLKCQNTKRDLRLLKNTSLKILAHDEITEADYVRIVDLYNMLYLKKYSHHNPQFSKDFIKLCHAKKLLTLYGVKDDSGIFQGVVGYFEKNKIITTPLVGYNTDLDPKIGLYRILIALVIRDASEKNVVLNLSSGASSFKILRGGFPEIEYSAVFVKHLSLHRKIIFHGMRVFFEYIGVTIMKRLKL